MTGSLGSAAPVVIPLVAALGLAVGSFLNVVIYRLPRDESVVRPGSRCPACAAPIRGRDNVPVLSWLVLRGRCRDCGAPISPRYLLVEGLTGVLFVAVAARVGAGWALPAFLYLAALAVALAAIDLEVHRLPNALVLPAYPVAAALLGIAALAAHQPAALLRALIGAAVAYGLYFLLALAYPAGMGFGDVKLAGVLGLYLGYLGWAELAVGLFAGFLLGGAFALAALALRRVRLGSAIPYGPFLLAGALLGVFAGGALADAYLALTL